MVVEKVVKLLLLLLEWRRKWRKEWWRKWWWRKVEMVGGDGRPRREAWLAVVGDLLSEKKEGKKNERERSGVFI